MYYLHTCMFDKHTVSPVRLFELLRLKYSRKKRAMLHVYSLSDCTTQINFENECNAIYSERSSNFDIFLSMSNNPTKSGDFHKFLSIHHKFVKDKKITKFKYTD